MSGQWLLAMDRALFTFINGAVHPAWLDRTMVVLTDVGIARPILVVVALALVVLGRRRGLVILLGAVATITLSDQLSAHVIKPWVGRERPCSALEHVMLLVKCTGTGSFPSSHAANTFAGALYFSRFAPQLALPLFALAFLVSISRVYVGVHYPLDLLAGALLGMACASAVLAFMTREGWAPRRVLLRRDRPSPEPSAESGKESADPAHRESAGVP